MSGASAVGPRYRILRRLGQGGMAEVFEAELAGELGFARRVAIKRMLADAAADPRVAHRFLDEARIASRLHHANIVAVLDVGLLDELPFQVLELVDGVNAQQLLQRAGGTLPLEVALAIAGEVAHALDHAHAASDAGGAALGVVHRDVKPSNILVSWAGDVKLADFGIALARDRTARTETGLAPGTLGFMAPEQRMRAETDGRADVFALGLTLHAMLTGKSPLEDPAVELAAIDGRPIPLDPSLPDDVRRLIARAVAPARLERPSAAQLANEIGAVLAPRLARDARGVIRAFVERLSAKRPAAGALDHLLGIEVIAAEVLPGEVPRYRTVARADAATVPVPKVEAPAPPPSVAAPGAVPRRRGRQLAVVSIAAVAVGVGGIGAWRLAAREGSAPAGDAVLLASAPIDGAPGMAVASMDAAAMSGDAAIAPAPAPAPADAPGATPGASVAKHRPSGRPSRPDAAVAAASSPAETGWLLVYGDELVGSQVLVDGGRWSGSVPNAIEVAVGRHSITVKRRDGTQLLPKQVDVASFHSAVRPLRITW